MVLILFLMSKLLTDSNALFSNQILHTITLFSSGSDDSSLVLVLAVVVLRVHVVRFTVLVFAGLLGAAIGGCRCHPLEADEERLQTGHATNGNSD